MNKGIFITFEGNDGSGKTTQILLLSEYLRQKGLEVVTLREPGGTAIGEKIREILLDNRNQGMYPVTEMLLYAASRAQLVSSVIKPELEKNRAVICDRFLDSSLAYQGEGRGLGAENVWAVNRLAVDGCLPDITFFMDLDADASMARLVAKGEGTDRIESEEMDFHRRVYSGYIKLARQDPDRIKRIDVNRNPQEVFAEIRGYMDKLLEKAKG